jgi:hypothetical protein
MALVGGMEVDTFVDNIFNFPTLAEAYRVAALDVAGKRDRTGASDEAYGSSGAHCTPLMCEPPSAKIVLPVT